MDYVSSGFLKLNEAFEKGDELPMGPLSPDGICGQSSHAAEVTLVFPKSEADKSIDDQQLLCAHIV